MKVVTRRIEAVLSGLREYEPTERAMAYDGGRVIDKAATRGQSEGGAKASKSSTKSEGSPPPGISFDMMDGDVPPPLNLSPYWHFKWHFEREISGERILGFLHAAERVLHRMQNPKTPTSEKEARDMVRGVDDGAAVTERVLRDFVDYPSDLVDLIEGFKPGTTRRIRSHNFCDELGNRKGVPPWAYDEFALLDELVGRERVMARFQIASSTYYDIKKKIRGGRR